MWKEEFDKQLDITFPDGNLHPAQYGQLTKFIQSKFAELIDEALAYMPDDKWKEAVSNRLKQTWL